MTRHSILVSKVYWHMDLTYGVQMDRTVVWDRVACLIFACAACAIFATGAAAADNYPTRPVRLIVPFAAGGNADIQARIIGQKLTEALGEQVVIDNRAGANGIIGSDVAAKATPDGYTLLFVASGHAINPGLHRKLPFDPVKSFVAVSRVGSTPLIQAVNPKLPARSVKELVSLARSKPGQLSFASQGNGSPGHLAGALFNMINKIEITHIPYKSTAQALNELASGQVQVMYPSLTSSLAHIKAGRLRGLAITTRERSPLAPDLPTMIEAGVPDYEAGIWNGILAPAGTPKAIVQKLNGDIVKIIANPEVAQRMRGLGANPGTSTPEAFGAFIAAEIRKWSRIIEASGARVD